MHINDDDMETNLDDIAPTAWSQDIRGVPSVTWYKVCDIQMCGRRGSSLMAVTDHC